MLSLSPLDLAVIKIHRLEAREVVLENRLAALRCRMTEILNEKPKVIQVGKGG
jgi:hypothetical protein